ncbi:VCBS repeat-containing protein [Tenacibaculum ascidiaceicola]|uniref:FG-GAP repeat domain-containing protein n=1 Tax=Tenacibaculum ascidiaceicola TaxID=1699411 RepID=UPI0039EA7E5B
MKNRERKKEFNIIKFAMAASVLFTFYNCESEIIEPQNEITHHQRLEFEEIGGSDSGSGSVLGGNSFTSKTTWSTDFGYNDNWDPGKYLRIIADVNGDGKGDIIAFGTNSTYVSLSTGSGFAPKKTWTTDFGYNDNWRISEHVRTVADVNGDGKGDIIAFGDNSTYVSLSTGSGFAPKTRWTTDFGYNDNWRTSKHVRTVADVNGDGKGDIIAFGNNSTYVSLSTGSGFAPKTTWTTDFGYNDNWNPDYYPRTVADVNGDGKADIVAFGTNSTHVSLSTGNGFAPQTTWTTDFGYNDNWDPKYYPRTVADVNGDGKADIVAFGTNSTHVSLSTGNGFAPQTTWTTDFGYNDGWRISKHVRTVSDANGDGKGDVVAFGSNSVYVANSI